MLDEKISQRFSHRHREWMENDANQKVIDGGKFKGTLTREQIHM